MTALGAAPRRDGSVVAPVRSVSAPSPGLRLVPFTGLAIFIALRWSAIVDPAASGRGWLNAGVAIGLSLALLAAGRLPGRARVPAAIAFVIATIPLVLLAAGAPARDLKPRHWHSMADGISSGLSSLPGIVTPYSGADRWTEVVILAGAGAGLVLAAAVAFWPRRRPATAGWPLAALVALIGLAAVPATVLEIGSAVFQGIILFVLLAAFLAGERLRAADAPVAIPVLGSLAAVAAVLAPALNASHSWINYESTADSVAAGGERFDWSQGYGPLHWPRTSKVVLQIKASHSAYWKAQNLDVFDGLRWQPSRAGVDPPVEEVGTGTAAHPNWVQRISVTVRDMRSRQMITAGDASSVDGSTEGVKPAPASPGTFVAKHAVGKGDYYSANVYTPTPTPAQLDAAGSDYPEDLIPARMLNLRDRKLGQTAHVVFPAFGASFASPYALGRAGDATSLVEDSSYARTYHLAQRLKEHALTPYDYVKAVQGYLGHGFTYTENPPRRSVPLESFLWRDKRGYCQQFAGAMALLLRMGGVPARVSVGFSPGRYDRQTGAWLVRDDEAHAWVEAWFPGIGWVTFDPTPAVAPAAGQTSTNREGVTGSGSRAFSLDVAARLSHDPLASAKGRTKAAANKTASHGGGPSAWLLAGISVAGAALLGGVALLFTRRRRGGPRGHGATDAWVVELERALRRAGRTPRPGTTLRQIEEKLGRGSEAGAYVAAVRALRYGAAAGPPTAHQRRGLRRELGRGLGPVGRLRAWWAVPPVPPRSA